ALILHLTKALNSSAKENSTWETKETRADSSARVKVHKLVKVNRVKTNRSSNSSSKTRSGVKITTWKPTSSVAALMATGKTRKESGNALNLNQLNFQPASSGGFSFDYNHADAEISFRTSKSHETDSRSF